jgi:broad specificity phosphatase PhoE
MMSVRRAQRRHRTPRPVFSAAGLPTGTRLAMARLYLIRHAKPAATWSEAADPGLDAVGTAQSTATAAELSRQCGALAIYTSPMLRCRHTAAPLERLWQRQAEVMLPVAEIPAPPLTLDQRHLWLQQAMTGTWSQLQQRRQGDWPDYLAWRDTLLARVTALAQDSVIFSHYIAINAIVGVALRSDDIVCFRPDHASITIVEVAGSTVRAIELGRQADTLVLTRA